MSWQAMHDWSVEQRNTQQRNESHRSEPEHCFVCELVRELTRNQSTRSVREVNWWYSTLHHVAVLLRAVCGGQSVRCVVPGCLFFSLSASVRLALLFHATCPGSFWCHGSYPLSSSTKILSSKPSCSNLFVSCPLVFWRARFPTVAQFHRMRRKPQTMETVADLLNPKPSPVVPDQTEIISIRRLRVS